MSIEEIKTEVTPSRLRDTDRKTRVHLALFDRIKFFLTFVLVFVVLVWASLANDPILTIHDAIVQQIHSRWWLLALFGIEVIRQIHFILAEKLAQYHGFWNRYFAFVDRQINRIGDWNRFRISRLIKVILLIALLAVILGAVYKEAPITALFLAPKALWSSLPLLGQLAFAVFFIIIQ